jgi:saccharopine dehydrogenase-like NADP-dependent oxidoreductase
MTNRTKQVIVLIGAGQIGQAISRRVGVGKHILIADRSEHNAKDAAEMLENAGYTTSVAINTRRLEH